MADEGRDAAESTRAEEQEKAEPTGPLLSFAVPEDLLREAVAASNAEDMVADLQLMPGVGEGTPPPMMSIFRRFGWQPVTYFTMAAFVVAVLDNGLTGTLAPNIQHSFRVNDAEQLVPLGEAYA